MTTRFQIKKWTQPLLEADTRLALVGRDLVLRPVRHLVRGVYVDQTSNRLRPRLLFHVQPLFAIPSEGGSFIWSREQPARRIDEDGFEASFLVACRDGLKELGRVETIGDFLFEADKVMGRPFGPVPIHRYKRRHSVVLASLGRFEDALAILAPALRAEEPVYAEMLAQGQAALAKGHRRGIARVDITIAEANLQAIAELKPLLALLEAGDGAGIAALLRGHEKHNAKVRKVEHLWEPSPFPFELA